jgi:hypothetical protein
LRDYLKANVLLQLAPHRTPVYLAVGVNRPRDKFGDMSWNHVWGQAAGACLSHG